ncbi:cardioactive peptide-like [Trichogramma pretiosum]|uniref:cardioactive peptide-like n=1 Tax=Trichogramma pretiosum TaxID=7493 RepID=UPI0006C97175|nr:cardioactive peptide-like [Trichogramma pretiosum]
MKVLQLVLSLLFVVLLTETLPINDRRLIAKRPFCNAFTGCGKKRQDPSWTNFVSMYGEKAPLMVLQNALRVATAARKAAEASAAASEAELRMRQEYEQQQPVLINPLPHPYLV